MSSKLKEALALLQAQRFHDAAFALQQIVQAEPDNFAAKHYLGIAC